MAQISGGLAPEVAFTTNSSSAMKGNEHTAAVFECHFDGTEPSAEREVDVGLILHAAEAGQRIDVCNAIIHGLLELKCNRVEGEIRLAGCDFPDGVRFSYCAFKNNLDLSGSTFRKECCFRAAAIAGEFRLIGATFSGPIARFDDLQVKGVAWADRVRFNSGARFRRAKFERSVFFRHGTFDGQVDFGDAQFLGEAAFTCAVFCHKASFAGVHILGQARFIGVNFRNDVSFNAARIESHALFYGAHGGNKVTRFDGSADFTACQIDLSVDFRGTRFKGRANFNSIHIGGDAHFWSEAGATPIITIFDQEADFTGAHFGGDADFSGVLFGNAFCQNSSIVEPELGETKLSSSATAAASGQAKSEEIPYISFNGATFDRHARFSSVIDEKHPPLVTVFGSDVDFTSARIGGLALFEGVEFKRDAYFNFVNVTGNARFSPLSGKSPLCSVFHGNAKFPGARVCGNVTFQRASFKKEATFTGMHVGGMANFECDKFEGPTAFDHAHFSQDVHFENAVFHPNFSFREASFGVVSFSPKGKVGKDDQFQGLLNLAGFTYNSIQVAWQSFLITLEGKPRIAFDPQSYNQLEKTFRLVGKDREADCIYLERCRVERLQKWDQGRGINPGWLGSALYSALANYGIRPVRLAVYSLVLIVIGAILFSQPGAVRPSKEEKGDPPRDFGLVSAKMNDAPQPTRLSFCGGLAVSVHQFLPVDIPSGTDWKPSGQRFMYVIPFHLFATILKIAGWIFVPLGVAAVTGLLRRAKSA